MRTSFRTGISFGLTSGVITTLGLIVGLYSGTGSRLVVIGGILAIAVADAFSDALGIHISEESERKKKREVWESAFAAFFSKLVIALTFIIPVLIFDLFKAIIISMVWGMLLLGCLSYRIAKSRRANARKAIGEHLIIAVSVVFATYFIGKFLKVFFN